MINANIRNGYLIHTTVTGGYILCKILKEYENNPDSKEKCINDLVDLLSHKITEKKLIKENNKVLNENF